MDTQCRRDFTDYLFQPRHFANREMERGSGHTVLKLGPIDKFFSFAADYLLYVSQIAFESRWNEVRSILLKQIHFVFQLKTCKIPHQYLLSKKIFILRLPSSSDCHLPYMYVFKSSLTPSYHYS